MKKTMLIIALFATVALSAQKAYQEKKTVTTVIPVAQTADKEKTITTIVIDNQKLDKEEKIITTIIVDSQDIDKEKDAIKKAIQTAYVEGLQNEGDADKIDSGIHPGFNLLGIGKNNTMWKYSITDWKADAIKKRNEGELPPTEDKTVTIKFISIDITGTAAMAKIEFYVGKKLTYVDYISLYKFDNGWKMVNKIFYKI